MDFLSKYILFCIGILYIKHVQNAPSPSKPMHLNIDEFISQLMKSENFNKLADDIAERAALKFKTLDLQNLTTSSPYSDSGKLVTKKNNIIEKQQYARVEPRFMENIDEEHEERNIYSKPEEQKRVEKLTDHKTKENKMDDSNNDYNPRLNKKDETSAVKFGKIDTKTFLKHDDSSQELYLNYKHLRKEGIIKKDKKIKETPKHASHDGDIFSDLGNYDDDDFSGNSKEQSKNKSKETDRKDMQMRINVQKHKDDQAIGRHSDEKGTENTTSRTINKKHLSPHSFKEVKPHARLKEADSDVKKLNMTASSQNLDDKSDSLDFENHHESVMNADVLENSEENTNKSSKEIIEVGINRAHSDLELSLQHFEEKLQKEEYQNNRDVKKPAEPIIEPTKEPKPMYRRERGKIYAFVSSPDYKEYHENLKNSNVFINTY